jgi:hypothetical protein
VGSMMFCNEVLLCKFVGINKIIGWNMDRTLVRFLPAGDVIRDNKKLKNF